MMGVTGCQQVSGEVMSMKVQLLVLQNKNWSLWRIKGEMV